MTVPSINMSHFLHFTTWQAGQTRKGFTNLPLHVGDSQTLFHTSCGYAFLQNAELLSRQYPENQKSRSQEPTKRFHFCSTSEKIFFSISPLSSLCFMRYPVTFYTRLFTKRHAVCFFTFFKSSVIIAAIYKTRNCMKYDFWKIRLNALGCFCEYAVPPVFHFRTAWQCSFPQLQAPELHP